MMNTWTHTFQKTCLIGLLLLNIQTLFAQKMDKTEKKMVSYIDEHLDEAFLFLEKAVNINSGTMNHEGVREVGRLFAPEFEALGMDVKWVEVPKEVNRAGHLVAEHKGSKGKRLLLIGHFDTVFEKDSPFQSWEKLSDSQAKGPGSNDMKGGDVVMLYALKALHASGAMDDTQIIVVCTGDEEKPGSPQSLSRKDLLEAGKRSDIALGFEGGKEGRAVVARRSSSGWKLTIKGTRWHSSQIFSDKVGSGAIFEMARILNDFHEKVKGEKYLTFNPGVVLGGTGVNFDEVNSKGSAFGKTNVVAQRVVVDGGIRTISQDQLDRTREKMKEIVENGNHPGTSANIEFSEGYPAMYPREENYELLKVYDRISQDLGFEVIEPYDPGARGAADISFVSFIPGLGGLGSYGEGGHTFNEKVALDTFHIAVKRAAVLLYRLTRE